MNSAYDSHTDTADAPSSSQQMREQTPLSRYFTTLQWVIFSLVVLAGVALRWTDLGDKPYHHDESQHAMFGKYFFDWPENLYYKYDPMLHGPVLYNLLRFVYVCLGNTNWSARAPIALIGTLFMFLPLIFRRYYSPRAAIGLVSAIALSPTLIYWSRFLIHDFLVILAQVITLYGVTKAAPKRKPLFVLFGFTLQYCIKANVFVTAAIVFGYLVFEWHFDRILNAPKDDRGKVIQRLIIGDILGFGSLIAVFAAVIAGQTGGDPAAAAGYSPFDSKYLWLVPVYFLCLLGLEEYRYWNLKTPRERFHSATLNFFDFPIEWAIALVVSIFTFCYIFTSGFRHLDGIIDGLYRKSIPYWTAHHNMERIQGPFLHDFYVLSWYELAFMAALAFQVYLFYRSAGKWARLAGLAILVMAFAPAIPAYNLFFANKPLTKFAVWKFFKLKDHFDVIGLPLLLVHPVIVTATHLFRREKLLAFWGYLFFASFFSYSYLGEKVPWLSMYPLVVGLVYLTLYFDDYFKRHPVEEWRNFPLSKVFTFCGVFLLAFGVLFTLEGVIKLKYFLTTEIMGWFYWPFTMEGISWIWSGLKRGAWDNLFFLVVGLSLWLLGKTNRWTDYLSRVNLMALIFVSVVIFNIRASILTNFVYAGSETEYISQVHTTREFQNVAFHLRNLITQRLRAEPIKVLAERDPVWPLTWYMIDVKEDFKFSASESDRKTFDYIVTDYVDNKEPEMPEGFEKRKITLRGWWVPEFKDMTFKNFFGYSLHHFPWSGTGFTYAWLLRNTKTTPPE